jgi:hypothetical protein
MTQKLCWILIFLCILSANNLAMACGGGGGGGDGTADGIAIGGPFSPLDPQAAEAVIGADGQVETISQNYRKGLQRQQAEQMAQSQKWIDEGNYYEKLEKNGETVQMGVNVAGSIVDLVSAGTTSRINKIGQHTADFVESGMESYNQGKSASQILEDAMIGAGQKAAKVDTLQKTMEFLKNIKNSSPNIKAPPAVHLGTPGPTDGSFGAGGPAPQDNSIFLM